MSRPDHAAQVVKELAAAAPRVTVAVAESLTCGRVQALLGGISGASNYLLGGVTAYTLASKVALLGVDRVAAKRVNCVSEAVAREMARGAITLFGAKVAVATTGYAQPDLAHDVPEPMAWWALAHRLPRGRWVERSGRIVGAGLSRVQMQDVVAEAVVAELADYLQAWRERTGQA